MHGKIDLNKITKPLLDQDMNSIFTQFFELEKFLDDSNSHVREWVIVKLVTVIEQFCRQIIKNQLDTSVDIKLPEKLHITITDLERAKKISTSSLIASQYNFQNIYAIINDLKYYNIPDISNKINKNALENLFNTRHNIVHTTSKQNCDIKKGYDATQQLLKLILSASPYGSTYYDGLHGSYFISIEEYTKSLSCYRRILETNVGDSMAHYCIGIIYYLQNNLDDAYNRSITMIDLNPKDPYGYELKGLVLIKQEKYEHAINCYNKLIKLQPKYTSAHYQKGVALSSLDKNEEALSCAYDVINLDPKYKDINLVMAKILSNLNKYESSLTFCDKEIDINPNNADIYYQKYLILSKLNKNDESKQCLDKALEINPSGKYQSVSSNNEKIM